MSRTVSPASFQLQATERAELLRNKLFLRVLRDLRIDANAAPVVLRWSTAPLLGFPVGPFEVWRRRPTNYPVDTLSGAVNVSGTQRIDWGLRPMYLVSVSLRSVTGSVRVVALDSRGKVIPGQDLRVTAIGSVLLRANGICAVRVEGTAQVAGILGVPCELLANATGWERFDTVGLPLGRGEVSPAAYTAAPQGYEPPSLDGPDAALVRLTIAAASHLPPPALPAGDLPAVDWPAPPPKAYLQSVRDRLAEPLVNCLETRDNASIGARHADFTFDATVPGMNQIGGSSPTPDAHAVIPLVGVVQLMALGDAFGSVALGYGTVDLGIKREGSVGSVPDAPRLFTTTAMAASVLRGWDYMVTGRFRVPFVADPVEIAALAALPPEPTAPTFVSVQRAHENRPLTGDAASSEALRVSWAPGVTYTSYGVVGSLALGNVAVLNAKRACGVGFDPYMAPRTPTVDGSPPPDERVSFTDPTVPVPVSGSASVRYGVAAIDVFGRWSVWRMASHTQQAPTVATPQILQLSLLPDAALASGTGCGGTMEIELGWNAEDRTLERIELFGHFFPAGGTPEASFTTGFLDGATDTTALSVRLSGTVSAERVPAAVTLLSGTAPQQRIRVTITDVRYDFSGGEKVGFAVWARAYEAVRLKQASAVVGPRRADALDPLPPAQPTLSPNITWTALPDATRRARGVLSWPATSNTRGYIVWEATETALLDALGKPAPSPGTSLVDRALALRGFVGASGAEDAISKAFARWNNDLLPTARAQIDLPAAADVLYAYRVSAMSATNIEGPRSTGLGFLAVPTRRVPGPPNLASTRTTTGGVLLAAAPAAGSFAHGYRLFRVRKVEAASALGTMGPPVALEAAWTPDAVDPGRATLVDTPATSWKPVYYRVVAVAADAPSEGRYGGISDASGPLPVFVPPPSPPTLTGVTVTGSTLNFTSDVPDFPTPIGTARLEVFSVSMTGERVERTLLAAADPARVPVGAATASTFGKATGSGGVTWSLLGGGATRLSVVVTDPLGRSTETTVEV